MKIALVRHAEDEANVLTAKGRKQSEQLAEALLPFRQGVETHLYTSDSPRAAATADIVARRLYLRAEIEECLGPKTKKIKGFIDNEVLGDRDVREAVFFLLVTHAPEVFDGAAHLAQKIQAPSFKNSAVGNAEGWLVDMADRQIVHIGPKEPQPVAAQPAARTENVVPAKKGDSLLANFMSLFGKRTF